MLSCSSSTATTCVSEEISQSALLSPGCGNFDRNRLPVVNFVVAALFSPSWVLSRCCSCTQTIELRGAVCINSPTRSISRTHVQEESLPFPWTVIVRG
ncbi:unnamed protein product [Acanthoscelides obtectus]|uniref:Uncharacterized protein n=1 Tax=Acanthoscelides obtectus TaxID=200917 RepID=A0A9P0NT79_ACAOB|nr:unnamed protein product [Acanthoscelides obtectus]CAK1661754.1 hypothetical protein AOBTE_LOCUS22776 [Acanthoscelides obtectus]